MLDGELGAAWQARNDAQGPDDVRGTRFDFRDLTGDGPYAAGRLTFSSQVAPTTTTIYSFARFHCAVAAPRYRW
jgi:hypothetical protein